MRTRRTHERRYTQLAVVTATVVKKADRRNILSFFFNRIGGGNVLFFTPWRFVFVNQTDAPDVPHTVTQVLGVGSCGDTKVNTRKGSKTRGSAGWWRS